MLTHIDAMNDYLQHLDRENTTYMQELIVQTTFPEDTDICHISTYDVSYFVSSTSLESIQIEQLHMFLSLEDSSLQRLSMVMYRIKGHFLLMASEFCHASETRISLRRHILQY